VRGPVCSIAKPASRTIWELTGGAKPRERRSEKTPIQPSSSKVPNADQPPRRSEPERTRSSGASSSQNVIERIERDDRPKEPGSNAAVEVTANETRTGTRYELALERSTPSTSKRDASPASRGSQHRSRARAPGRHPRAASRDQLPTHGGTVCDLPRPRLPGVGHRVSRRRRVRPRVVTAASRARPLPSDPARGRPDRPGGAGRRRADEIEPGRVELTTRKQRSAEPGAGVAAFGSNSWPARCRLICSPNDSAWRSSRTPCAACPGFVERDRRAEIAHGQDQAVDRRTPRSTSTSRRRDAASRVERLRFVSAVAIT
jgi:hypothetical protein